jgi:GTPase SAR1 family protein
MCLSNSFPCLVYGDVGIGKTFLMDKILNGKFDFVKMASMEPDNNVYKLIVNQTEFCRSKRNSSIIDHKSNFVYFIDDLNVKYSCDSKNESSNMELLRQIMETKMIYSYDDESLMPITDINFAVCLSYPDRTPNHLKVSQSITKSFVCVHLNPVQTGLIESIFSLQIRDWLEEFPPDLIQQPTEMAHAIIRTLCITYKSIRDHLNVELDKPFYLFNFKDVTKVVQGLQLLASKSKVVPANKAIKKQQDQQESAQVALIIKLFHHEMMRVFADRMSEESDEIWLKSLLRNVITKTFCTEKTAIDDDYYIRTDDNLIIDDKIDISLKPMKKAVKFKAGLLSDRSFGTNSGPLIKLEQVTIYI